MSEKSAKERRIDDAIEGLVDVRVKDALGFLRGEGYDAWLVGGAVRDALRGLTPDDYDLAWSGTPQDLYRLLPAEQLHATGEKHGTMTWVLATPAGSRDLPLEITSFRKETGYSDHRRPDAVVFVDRIEDDLARRDLTINAMAWAPGEGLVDPFGGQRDLAAGRIRTVGEPQRRFAEDALRILRTLRFAALLEGKIDSQTREAMHAQAGDLQHVARERIWAELLQLLLLPGAGRVIGREQAVLQKALPFLRELTCEEVSSRWLRGAWRLLDRLPEQEHLRLAWGAYVLLVASGEEALTDRLTHWLQEEPLSRKLRQGTLALVRALELLGKEEPSELQWMLQFDATSEYAEPRELLWLTEAAYELQPERKLAQVLRHGQKLFEHDRRTLRPGVLRSKAELAVRGRDLLAWGVPEGPGVREALEALWLAVLRGEVANEPASLQAWWLRESGDKG